MKPKFLIALCVVICIGMAGCGSNASADDGGVNTSDSHQPTEAELRAMYAAEELFSAWNSEDLPSYTGGAYADGEACVVLLLTDSSEYREEVAALSSYEDILTFQSCAFSFAYLTDVYYEVQALAGEAEQPFIQYNISIPDNCLVVSVLEENEELLAEIRALDVAEGSIVISTETETVESDL